jgi:hypothetical protein
VDVRVGTALPPDGQQVFLAVREEVLEVLLERPSN